MLLENDKMVEIRVRDIAQQIGAALEYLHSNGIMLRNLDAQGILMSQTDIEYNLQDAIPKIGRLGCSIITGYNHLSKGIFGDIRFRAPEVLQNKHYDFRADSWSFGVIIFLMLTGRFPFDDYEYTNIPITSGAKLEDYPERILVS